jgi:PAS domain S-box-containing protein
MPATATRPWKKLLKRLPIVRTIIAYFRTVNVAADDGSDLDRYSYGGWRDRFLQMRLHLTFGLGATMFASFCVLDVVRSWQPLQGLNWLSLLMKVAIAALLLVLRSRLHPDRVERHLLLYFLGVVGIVQVLPESLDLLSRATGIKGFSAATGLYQWSLLFFIQATLIPVRWRWHALSQALVLIHAFGGREWVGIAIRTSPRESRLGLLLGLFWVCLACDLSVYLYERLQRAEFSARSQLAGAYRDLEVAEENYRSLFENAVEGIFQASIAGQYLSVNPAFARMYGYPSPEAAIAAVSDIRSDLFVNPGAYDQLLALLEHQGRAMDFEVEVRRASGGTFWISENVRALRDADGTLVAYEGIAVDISPRKLAEEEIRRTLAAEKQLNRLKTDFVAMTSHEFRTPLTTILAASESLEYYGGQWPEAKRHAYLKRIQGAAAHMGELLDSVLTIGQADTGKLPFRPEPIAVEPWCRALIEEMDPLLGCDRAIHLRGTDTAAIPKVVQLDEQLLRHILMNLLSNALKYSEADVDLELGYHLETLTVRVSDRGIGIPQEARSRLFESFHRAANVGQRPGTGLGLAIVSRAVDLHGGTIAVSSQEGQGTTFTVTLPAPTRSPLGQPEPANPEHPPSALATDLAPNPATDLGAGNGP